MNNKNQVSKKNNKVRIIAAILVCALAFGLVVGSVGALIAAFAAA